MSKFCENCGAEMDDNQTVCPNCGNGAEATNTTTVDEGPINEPTSSNKTFGALDSEKVKKYGVIAGIAAVVVIIIAILSSILGSGWKKPIDNYFKGMQKANAKTYLSAYPDFYVEKYYSDLDDEDLEDDLDDMEDTYGEKIKITYKVTKKEKIKKDDLKKVQEYIEKYYDEDVKVSAGYEVKVRATIKGKEDDNTATNKMYVYKIDGKWKLFNTSPSTAKDYLKSNK